MKPLNALLGIAVAAFLLKEGYHQYQKYQAGESSLRTALPPMKESQVGASKAPTHPSLFACDGRTQCGQMTSCEEAKFFLAHCPNTQMDGDMNGVPCEKNVCL